MLLHSIFLKMIICSWNMILNFRQKLLHFFHLFSSLQSVWNMIENSSGNLPICILYLWQNALHFFANFSCIFLNPNFFPIWILIYKRWEICRNKLKMHSVTINCPELPQLAWISCSSDLKKFANSRPSASNFIRIFQSLNHFFLTVGQNNFGNKIPLLQVMQSAKMREQHQMR